MGHVPMCQWCGEHEVGSIDGGHTEFCSNDCALCGEMNMVGGYVQPRVTSPCDWCGKESVTLADGNVRYCSEKCREESDTNRAAFESDHLAWESLADCWDDGRYDDDPSPYGGTYSED